MFLYVKIFKGCWQVIVNLTILTGETGIQLVKNNKIFW